MTHHMDEDRNAASPEQRPGHAKAALNRRQFLQAAGAGVAATSLGRPLSIMAGPFGAADTRHGHLIPEDKALAPGWVASLFERGTKEVYAGKALDTIGMPCGGIGTGQLYLCGDGTLGCWQIFNNAVSNWAGDTHATYEHEGIAKPVAQGFRVRVRQPGGQEVVKRLCKDDFAEVRFKGEYPIGTVAYEEAGFPARVEMEAFSPFVPLEGKDSALPTTLFHITVENTGGSAIEAGVMGWLGNGVCYSYGKQFEGRRTTRTMSKDGYVAAVHGTKRLPPSRQKAEPERQREPVVFEDFEGADYGDWRVEGAAFGEGPAGGTLQNQQNVTGYLGEGLVNTFLGGDAPKGTLTSPAFTIERHYINFLIGGGGHADRACMNLVVDGEVVLTATGANNELLTWRSWDVRKWEGKQARLVIVDDASGGWGHINIDHIEFADKQRHGSPVELEKAADYGTMALGCLGGENVRVNVKDGGPIADESDPDAGLSVYSIDSSAEAQVTARPMTLAPGEKKTVTFVLAWHFPNQPNGHEYAARFDDAAAVVDYAVAQHERLTADTRLWRNTYYDSTLPYWLLDRLHSTVSTLATGTCQWWKNGRFWAYEGVTCCAGTCTHVWNYAHAHARLFPAMTRTIREMQDFCPREDGGGFHPDTGLVGFRSNDAYAADGQCGTVLKAYREHLMSADTGFLERNWPRIKKALDYSIGRDANADGLIEDEQHNTYDINYHGANTFVGSLYLAALRAAEEMALEMGDEAYAKRVRSIYEKGVDLTLERLWNGEYFVQDVDLGKHPQHQYKDGCLSDHLFGQGWAHQVGLGYIYPAGHVRSAIQAVWKYNWAPDIGPYNEEHKPFRWFISPGQAGLFTCTWPNSTYLPEGTVYKNEVWTGIEYQVAGHLIWEGFVKEGLAICRAVHDRYHPNLFNPYNEIECGDHYARAMASWGVYLALGGFRYHGPRGHVGFAPKISPENFRAAYTFAEGWGAYTQTRADTAQVSRIAMRHGRLRVASLSLEAPAANRVEVTLDGARVPAAVDRQGNTVELRLDHEVAVEAGSTLEVTLV